VITKDQVISRILSHLHLPVSPELLADDCTLVYDVTEQPMPGWVVGADPDLLLPNKKRAVHPTKGPRGSTRPVPRTEGAGRVERGCVR
jgi:hypothetical protein